MSMPECANIPSNEDVVDDLVVVDDDRMFTMLLERKLRHSNKQYKIFNNSKEAMGYLHQATPTTLLFDLKMPGLDGIQCLEALSKIPRSSPPNLFLCSSCHPLPDVCETINSLGAKIITKDQLLTTNTLLDLLDNSR